MPSRVLLTALIAATTLLTHPVGAAPLDAPPTPAEHLGRPVGTDFELADWDTLAAYFDRLAAASDRVQVTTVGRTTEGRDFRLVAISSADNLARIDTLKQHARRLADPRGLDASAKRQLVEDARLFLFISCNMHSTEVASAEMSMQLAYDLATGSGEPWESARRELVVLLAPSLNPDGLDHVVEWYREIRGTPYESASLPELYQYYAGHDNNRDWFLLSLEETRLTTRLLYTEWFPQVYWDVHQQGSRRERLFVPPYRDPLNPNLDPNIVTGINTLGTRMQHDLTRAGLTGVSTGVTYDLWWNGGNRSVPARHNIIGLLSEAASANLASPIFIPPDELRSPNGIDGGYRPSNRFPSPWPGGWWRLHDIIEYELALARSLLGSLARERTVWLGNALEAAERAIGIAEDDPPAAWLIPADTPDRDALTRLLDSLILGGIEVERATAPFRADGRDFPAGTLILARRQPYGGYLKDLFELQRYPDGPAPYDVAGWTLPLLLGVRSVAIHEPFTVERERVPSATAAVAELPPAARPAAAGPSLSGADTGSLHAVTALLRDGIAVRFDGADDSPSAGAWVLRNGRDGARARKLLAARGLDPQQLDAGTVAADSTGRSPATDPDRAERAAGSTRSKDDDDLWTIQRLPRVGVYAPWTGSMDEGWTRWVLDRYGMPYLRLRNENIRAGRLDTLIDVLIVPSVDAATLRDGRPQGSVFPRYAGGLDPEGSVAIEEFVRGGGTLIAFDAATEFVVDLFDLPLVDAAAKPKGDKSDDAFHCPGSILRTVPVVGSRFTAGLEPSQPVFFSYSRAWRVQDDLEAKERARLTPLLVYPASRILLSGWARKEQTLSGASAWLRAEVGAGQVHLFGVRPQYRAWTHTNFGLLFRSMLLESVE